MADQATRIPLAQAEQLAAEVLNYLSPAAKRIQIAGSIRRRKPDAKDIEIVAETRLIETTDLFNQPAGTISTLDVRCNLLVQGTEAPRGLFELRRDKDGHPRWGDRYKAMVYKGVPVDLFIVRPDTGQQWGLILAIRTGPSAFSKALVTRKRSGGLLPDDCQVDQGAIYRGFGLRRELVATPEEDDVFRLVGLPFVEPPRRDWPLLWSQGTESYGR